MRQRKNETLNTGKRSYQNVKINNVYQLPNGTLLDLSEDIPENVIVKAVIITGNHHEVIGYPVSDYRSLLIKKTHDVKENQEVIIIE